MFDDSAASIIEKYMEDLKEWLPLIVLAGAILFFALYWCAIIGNYHSATLSLLNIQISTITTNHKKTYDLPIYIFLISFMLSIGVNWLSSLVFIHYVKSFTESRLARQPTHSTQLALTTIVEMSNEFSVLKISESLERNRVKLISLKKAHHYSFSIGLILIFIAYFGNILDFALGALLVIFSIGIAHKASKTIIDEVLPDRVLLNSVRKYLAATHDKNK